MDSGEIEPAVEDRVSGGDDDVVARHGAALGPDHTRRAVIDA